MIGALLMGTGGILSMRCTIGQGLSAFSTLAGSVPITMAIACGARVGLEDSFTRMEARRVQPARAFFVDNLARLMSTNSPCDAAGPWNRRLKGPDFLFGTEPNQWSADHATAFPLGGRVLCVADGEGRNSVWLAKQGFQVDAFDIADIVVGKARRFAAQAGVTVNYQIADCESYPWPTASYHGIAAI
jgi:2-polyprenyl-3-methyl-5-hydroxy-6-metoxy-1,4-benzoquinol methylase